MIAFTACKSDHRLAPEYESFIIVISLVPTKVPHFEQAMRCTRLVGCLSAFVLWSFIYLLIWHVPVPQSSSPSCLLLRESWQRGSLAAAGSSSAAAKDRRQQEVAWKTKVLIVVVLFLVFRVISFLGSVQCCNLKLTPELTKPQLAAWVTRVYVG